MATTNLNYFDRALNQMLAGGERGLLAVELDGPKGKPNNSGQRYMY